MKRILQLFLLILCAGISLRSHAQTCTGEVLNISAATPSINGTISSWTVPSGGPYKIKITAKGAVGGDKTQEPTNKGGKGASMIGEFMVSSGQILQAITGAPGQTNFNTGGGGGGSGVQIQMGALLVLAGGGGGSGNTPISIYGGKPGVVTNSGTDGGPADNGGGGGGGYIGNGQNSSGGYSGGGGGGGYNGIGGFGSSSTGFGGGGFGAGGGGGHICNLGCAEYVNDFSGGGGGGYSGGHGGYSWDGGGGGGSYNIGLNQNNTAGSNSGGDQVIIECLGTAAISATLTPTQPTCASNQGSLSIDLTGDLNGYINGDVEYAIVSGGSFSGNPAFTSITAEPFNVSTGTGTTAGTYTVRIRLKYNPDVFTDQTYTLTPKLTGTIYVNANATGNNNGSSWTHAFTSLQDALTAACSDAEIWVAAGTYKPTTGTDRNVSFVMKNGVALYGGFSGNGTETQRSQRNWRSNATILSGNIGNTGVDTDNSYRVINNNFTSGSPLGNTAVLDGFTVEKGYANGSFPLNLGAGMWNAYASPKVQNCVFRNNFATSGAGMFNDNSETNVTNCLFTGNSCSVEGAALSNGGGTASAKAINCTFYGNTGGNSTIRNEVNATAISNCILWGNTNGALGGTVSYSIVQGGFSGTGNLNSDPLLVNAAGGDFRLQACSPAIDGGTDTGAPSSDYEGNNRVNAISGGALADIGVYEYQSSLITNGIWYVNANSAVAGNGTSWDCAARDLQLALSKAESGDQIWVAKGTYYPTTGTDRSISFSMKNGVAIYGGFNGTETQLSQRNWRTNVSVLSGDIGATGNNSDNSYHVIANINNGLTTANSLLDGFSITDGKANGSDNNSNGGGMFNYNSSPNVSNCTFLNNQTNNGGGMFNYNSSPSVSNCNFTGNQATQSGGGVYNSSSSPSVSNCTFSGNQANIFGGGMLNAFSSSPILINVTFSGNQANNSGGMFNHISSPNLRNCIFWGNSTEIVNDNSNPNYTHCLVQGQNPAGTGNLDGTLASNNPRFVSQPTVGLGTTGDLRLQQCSPAINAGDPATTSATVGSLDLGGNPRFYNSGRVDIGAYEYQGTFDAVAPAAQVTNSTCSTAGGTPSGGVISAPSSSCPAGSSLYYSTDNGGNWSTTVPTYTQEGPAQTILTRCACDANPASFGPTNSVTTTPGTCPACPDLTSAAPAVQVTNSVCTTFGGTASGGLISAPSSSCPAGSTLQYSTDNGNNWSTTLPIYAQSGPAQTILTRCNCNTEAGTSSPTNSVTTVPGTCPTCPDLTSKAPAVQVANSVCTTFGGTASGGLISAPSSSCPAGSTLYYSTDNGNNWSTTLPIYAQSGPAQTILTRCTCDADPTTSSQTSTVTTVPGTCPACPVLTSAAPAVQVTNSVCTTFGGTASGGLISAPSSSCPAGSTLQYSTDNGDNWSTTLPIYTQSGPAQTILTRCNCNADAGTSSPTSTMTTTPGTCPACPVLTSAAPAVQVTNSVCMTFGGTASGGSISAPSGTCPVGSTLQYSTDNGNNWSTTLPTYAQSGPAQTILTRCTCDANPATSSPTNSVTTTPGTCPACPDLTSTAPAVQVTNSVCTTFGGTASGGVISAPSSSCPAGSTLYYSTDNGNNWSTTLPIYAQSGPVQTILTRCTCDANPATSSPTNSITTVPGTCPNCPVLTAAAPAVQVTNSTCQAGCTVGGGSISAPGTNCPVGATLQYRLNGAEWNTTLPTYAQTGPAQTIQTRCVCNADASQFSPESAVTTVPGTVPALIVPANGSATVSCPTLAIQPLPPVVNDCNGNPIVPFNPEITNSPNPLTCEGTRTYTYNYVCGTNTATWSFVYTIEREPFTISTANGSATVYDPSLAVAPTPPTVVSHCGETLTPSAPVIANNPNPLLCEGTRTYAYTYTDCEGNTATWIFVYTVLDNIAPTISCPANLVACEGQTITFTPPVGTDNCTGAVTTQIAGLPAGSVFPVGVTTNTFKVTATNGQSTTCSFTVTVQGKPTITLATLQQTLNEGNSQTFCDTDANPVNGLQFTVSGACVVGNPVWRSQGGNGAWSAWSTNPPTTQSSNNQLRRYQAACDANCPVTYTSPIELTINYRASVPQNVSLVADGVTVNAGETKDICNIEGNALIINATCGTGEILLYSVDGAEYSSTLPTQFVDGQFHNYRVRCRKSDGTASCVESESGVMRLRIVSSSLSAPVASLNVTSGCGSPVALSGTANCGTMTTIWYNAITNVALATLPNQTPTETSSYYARCQASGGCLSEKSNVVTYTVIPVSVAPVVTASQEIVCTGTTVTVSANCPAGSQTFWNTGVTAPSFEVAFSNVTKQTYWAKCIFEGGCQSAESIRKEVYWNAFVVTLINIGESKSSVKTNDRAAWSSQFITRDGGPELEQSSQQNPTLYFIENANKTAPRYWTINVDACALGTNGSLTFDMLATPEMGVIRSFNTHENNAPYFMYANREGWTELYAQNHPAYGFYQDNGSGGNVYDEGLPKGLCKLGVRYWDQKGQGSIYPSTRQPAGNVLAYQEYWFRIQSKNGVGTGSAKIAADNGQRITDNGDFAQVMPNPVSNTLHLKVSEAKDQKVTVNLLDASGRTLLQRAFTPESNQHQEEFNVSEMANGMYFLKVNAADKQTTLKVVKVQ